MAKKAITATASQPPQQIIDRSVQEGPTSLQSGPGGGNAFVFWMASIADIFSPWGVSVKERDKQLRDWWHTEPVLASAIYTVTSANAGFKWELEGPEETTKQVQEILQMADMGKGWRHFTNKISIDLYTQDNGAFIEIIRSSNSPSAPIVGISHLEAYRCLRTGDLEIPVVYEDRRGQRHKMPYYSVVVLEEFPSPIEEMHSVQYCAVTRILRMAQIMRDIAIFRGEKVGGRFTEAIHIIGGVKQSDIDDIRVRMEEQSDNQGLARYLQPLILAALDPQSSPTSTTINMKALPESFNLDDELRWYISVIAMGFGRDYQDFAPLPRGGLGSGAQSGTLHLKSSGKGPATFRELITHALNAFMMPKTVTFKYAVQDIEAELKEAQVRKARAEARAIRIQDGEISPILARQIAQDEGDLDIRYLDLMGEADLTPAMMVEQGEKPEEEGTTRREEEKFYAIPDIELDEYVGGIKGFFQRAIANVKRETEESEAVQALKVASGVLADSKNLPADIHLHVSEKELPEIIMQESNIMEQIAEKFDRLEDNIKTYRRNEEKARKNIVAGIVPATSVIVSQDVIARENGRISRIKRVYSDGSVAEFNVERDEKGRIKKTVRA